MIRHRNLKMKKKRKNGFYDFKIHYKGWEDSIILHNACITRLGIRSRGLDKIINKKKGIFTKEQKSYVSYEAYNPSRKSKNQSK